MDDDFFGLDGAESTNDGTAPSNDVQGGDSLLETPPQQATDENGTVNTRAYDSLDAQRKATSGTMNAPNDKVNGDDLPPSLEEPDNDRPPTGDSVDVLDFGFPTPTEQPDSTQQATESCGPQQALDLTGIQQTQDPSVPYQTGLDLPAPAAVPDPFAVQTVPDPFTPQPQQENTLRKSHSGEGPVDFIAPVQESVASSVASTQDALETTIEVEEKKDSAETKQAINTTSKEEESEPSPIQPHSDKKSSAVDTPQSESSTPGAPTSRNENEQSEQTFPSVIPKEDNARHSQGDIPSTRPSTLSQNMAQPTMVVLPPPLSTAVGGKSSSGEATQKQQSIKPDAATEKKSENPLDDASHQRIESLENELNDAKALISKLKSRRKEEATMLKELQGNLDSQISKRAEAEESARLATSQTKKLTGQLDQFRKDAKSKISDLQVDLKKISKEKSDMEVEFEKIREERDEQARREASLTTRLNTLTKEKSVKTNAAEHYEDKVEYLEKEIEQYEEKVKAINANRDQLKTEVADWKEYAEKKTKQLESALKDEKKLNDERKRKMKGFVEAKTEEVRSAKADQISLQTELDQTNQSLKDLNQRYKQLHAQWVQSQTRNRELQRDMTKMKVDSEKMSKVGGTLEAKLSRSALETEDHKNKRLAAKNELMSVLAQLETEREVNSRLRETIRDTFTPKALSQQQLIQEALDDFESGLQKLATRLRRQLTPPPTNGHFTDLSNGEPGMNGASFDHEVSNDSPGKSNLSDINTTRVLAKLENETQRVSQSIVTFSTSVERMHALLEGTGSRSCVDALQDILLSNSAASSDETTAMTGGARRTGGTKYGHVAGTLT